MRNTAMKTWSTGNKEYQSKTDRHELYDNAQTERVIVRVPFGAKKIIEAYQKDHSDEYSSVNALVNKLLEREIFGEGHTFKEALGVPEDQAVQPTEAQMEQHKARIDKKRAK